MCEQRRNIAGDLLKRFLREMRGWWFVGGLLTVMALTAYSQSQTGANDPGGQSDSSVQSAPDPLMPLPPSLDTDLPLRIVTSPFRFGRFSLVSFSAFQGYDSNPGQATSAQGTEFSSFSGLVVYSLRGAKWNLDLQYQPSVFLSPKLTSQNWTGNATDFQAERRLSSKWSFNLADRFRYSPNLQSSIQGDTLSVNLDGGVAISTPFLSTSRSLLLNTASGSLLHRISEHTLMEFHADESLIRLSGTVNAGPTTEIPVEDSESTTAGLGFNHVLGPRDSIEVRYDYRAQFSSNTPLGVANFHTASFGWSHVLAPTLRVSVSGGPGWSNPGTKSGPWRTTAQGSVQLSKETRSGGIALSFARSDVFAGVIGNGFNNHYALRIDRKLGTRLNLTATGGYIQQQFFGAENQAGEMGSFEAVWSTTRNWSVFGQLRYLDTHGSTLSIAPQKVVTLGFRWSWVPEQP
jgi:hypothetical protein